MTDLLVRLSRMNRTTAFLIALVVGLAGLFAPVPLGPVLLYAVVAALAALLTLTWSVTPPPLRLVRVLILAALATLATLRLLT